ncbi:hypothetical protein BV898_04851 [Hypsibius exemplaris]|uniref:Constitutive coactivator of peroxisome proliferator-activated receptor gamma n=1 Tax=Hypsibius exemplaris TaxID=2072580 RepID=A0A1W0X0R5_HYPEX|nr:hypothetical protein BV898_04851 [Hypsibius exemplaris]
MIKTDSKAEVKPFALRYTKAATQNGGSSSPTRMPSHTKILPPFTSLSLVPNELKNLIRKQPEVVVADLLRNNPSMVLIDAGSPQVLARLYGGFHPDWVCGGLWTNSSNFTGCIAKFCKDKKHKLVIAFDSSIDSNNLNSWLARMEWDYENMREIFHVVQGSGHAPISSMPMGRLAPLWFPPTGLQTTLRLICLSLGIKLACTLYEHEPELVAVPDVTKPESKSLMDEVGVFFTNSLEFLCYTDLNVANMLWGESLKLNMRGDRMTGKTIDRDEVAGTLGIAKESLDAGLLYYGTRYFLDYSSTEKSKALQEHDEEKKAGRADFDPTEDLHHEMHAALTAEDSKPERRLKQTLSIMRQVHQDGINKKNSLNVGESLLPSLEHVTRCLKEGTTLPPDLTELSRDDEQAKIEGYMARLRSRAEDAFFEIGGRLIEGRLQTPPEPYYKEGTKIVFPHQMRFTKAFLEHLEKHHRSGHNHEWIGQLVFAADPTIRLAYTLGDRGHMMLKLKESPKMCFRGIRLRAYGFLFGSASAQDFALDNAPQQVYVREIDYAGIDVVTPSHLSPDISRITPSSEALWGNNDRGKKLFILLNIVFGGYVPRNWESMFAIIPEHCWVPVIAVRYMLDRCSGMFVPEDFLDVLLATVASVALSRSQNPTRLMLSDYDRTQQDANLVMDGNSITFASYFMTAVEHVIFANDVVHQAIPLDKVTPTQYFDGNIFHTFYELRKRNNTLEGFLDKPEQKMAYFLKCRHVVLHDFRDPEVHELLLWPRADTADSLIRNRIVPANVLDKANVQPRRNEQKRNWEAAADPQQPPQAEQRSGVMPNPYGFQPIPQPQPVISMVPLLQTPQPLFVDQMSGQFYHAPPPNTYPSY